MSWTLKQVCNKLLRDAPETRLLRRADTLRILGRYLYAIGKASETTKLASLERKDKDIEEIKWEPNCGCHDDWWHLISEKNPQFLIKQQRMMKAQQEAQYNNDAEA